MAKWNWPDKEPDVTNDLKEAWDRIDALGEDLPTIREQIIEVVRQESGLVCSDAADRILATFAVIPKEPTDGLEVDVPAWVVNQIEADIRADLNAFIERASKLAFDTATREGAAYVKGWNDAVAVEARGEELEPITADDLDEEPEEDVDEAMRQADA